MCLLGGEQQNPRCFTDFLRAPLERRELFRRNLTICYKWSIYFVQVNPSVSVLIVLVYTVYEAAD